MGGGVRGEGTSGTMRKLPGKPVAYNYELLSVNYGLLWGIVACFLGYLAFQVGEP